MRGCYAKNTLHSTMSSINLFPFRATIVCAPTLHSTMSSINRQSTRTDGSCRSLYIPLCHLLIKECPELSYLGSPLHSTMSSINRTNQALILAMLVPLHSTMSSINRYMGNAQFNIPGLYIPLCHLLILCFPMHTRHFSFFTFHYVIY